MKKRLHFPFILMMVICAWFMIINTLIAQSSYKWQNPLPQGNTLYSVCFTDANRGTAVGYTGTILHTNDGGLNWTFQSSGLINGERLWCVDFTDVNNGTVVGDLGKILHTTNGGATWIPQISGTTVTLNGVDFTDANTGTVVGVDGTILRTTNGGATWVPQTSGTPNTLYAVSFVDANIGTAVGMAGTIIRTTDGGATWNYQFNLANYIYGVSFTDANNGTIVGGEGAIFHTTDGGLNWILQTSGIGSTLVGVDFIDADTGMVSSCGGEMLRTTDGGVTWLITPGVSPIQLYGISFSDANHGTAVGEMGKIVHTIDGGIIWTHQSSSVTSNILNSVSFTDGMHGTAVGDSGRIVRTDDGGVNWNLQTSVITDLPLKCVDFTDVNNGTAVGFSGKVIRTTNGGATWNLQTSATTAMLFGVSFSDSSNGVAVGGSRIIRTSNAGATWTALNTTWTLYGVCMVDASIGTAVGSLGRIVRTINGGATWAVQTSFTTKLLYSVSFFDANNGVAVGQTGTILRTTNGGVNWITIIGPTTLALYTVSRADLNNLTAVAMSGLVIKSTDGGLHWTKQITSENYLFGVSYTDTNNVTVVGQAGVILAIHNNPPNQPSVITGLTTPCIGSSQTYSVINNPGVTYNWQFPSDWTITAGNGTNSVSVTVGSISGTVSVTPSNLWGSGPAQNLAVNPVAGLPNQPSSIIGQVNPLEGASENYSVTNEPGVTYTWTFPAGWIQTGGGTTNSVIVTVGSSVGNVSVTPSTPCGVGTSRTLEVSPVPANLTITNVIIANGQTQCFNAVQTIYIAGGGTTFTVQYGGSATMIAGQNIIYLPGTTADSGSYMHGYITLTGNYCTNPSNPVVNNPVQEDEQQASAPEIRMNGKVRIYPNPTTGDFTLEQKGDRTDQNLRMEIYGMLGERIMSERIIGENKHQFTLGHVPAGIYLVRVLAGNHIETIKLIKQ